MPSRFSERLDTLAQKARPWVPFTALNTVWRMIDKGSKSILDVGCGKGEPMKFINRHKKFRTMGVDVFEPYIEACKAKQIHDEYLMCNICNLPFVDGSFDVVMCMEVLEHLEKEEGDKLIRDMERIARKQVILTTPVGKFEQEEQELNPYQKHRSSWLPAELKSRGYRIRGYGLPLVGGQEGFLARLPEPIQTGRRFVWVMASSFTYYLPELAGWMVCTKKIGK